MQVSCPHCSRVLEVSGDPPVFCAYCGKPLRSSDPRLVATAVFGPSGPADLSPGGSGGGSAVDETAFSPSSGSGFKGGAGHEPDPEQVAGYRIIRLLGRGGMGSVYEAEDSTLGRRVALKLIAADHVTSGEAVERFRQEGRLASTIAHPRCVFVLGADEHLGRPYIVMELMPGETLQALVERSGPLPVGEAIAKMLDVIEGLQEAHLQGVIHRDVKPSNCFLDADGRVKVGDFGLSKSLDDDAGLTRTGSFIGTPLYASPEQIKRDGVDERTDVYSVAATLYFLLTGRPPFQGGDAAAVLAKIVSEDPTPMRELRADLPAALEAVILRGMERDCDRRYADLERLRSALLPFVSLPLRLPDMALRASAFFADMALFVALFFLLLAGVTAAGRAGSLLGGLGRTGRYLVALGTTRLALLTYFGVLEGVWGASVGKRLTGLRVSRDGPRGAPGVGRALGRVAAFYGMTGLPHDAVSIALARLFEPATSIFLLLDPVSTAAGLSGALVVGATMRARNGYRGMHEFFSGTRVVRLPRPGRRRVPRGRRPTPRHLPDRSAPAHVGGVLKAVGPFTVRGAVRWDGERRVLLGEDPGLGRPVWIVLRARGSAPPSAARRDLGRPGRPRWLNGGEQGDYRWDAYAPQLGCPLADLAGPDGLPWADVRPILLDLADELARACADATLPPALSVDQVWIQPDGTVQLVDPLEVRPGPATDDVGRALDLLRRTAAVALEGGRRGRRASEPLTAIHAPVPAHAGRMLDRLIGHPRRGDAPYADVAALVADLDADRDKPTEVDTARRAAHLGPCGCLTLPLLAPLFILAAPGRPDWMGSQPWTALAVWPALFVVWAALTRGGLLLGLFGLALVGTDSRPAGRLRCAWRALIVWAPVIALLAASVRADGPDGPWRAVAWSLWVLALALLPVYALLALVFPSRSVHDRLAGTWLVPK